MNNDTKFLDLPSLVSDLFIQHSLQIDNLFTTLWTQMHINTLLHGAGFHKLSGIVFGADIIKSMVLNDVTNRFIDS